MGSMFSGNRMSKEEMEVVVNKAKEIVSAYPVVVFRFILVPSFSSGCFTFFLGLKFESLPSGRLSLLLFDAEAPLDLRGFVLLVFICEVI